MSAPFSQAQYPALYLYPINDSFVPKHITLTQNQRVKIGRQTNAKTGPGERNGYFDSKVLSRQHAEIWSEGGKIFIRDVKSSNGTFVNGERCSAEGMESDPWELKTHDIVEFGIDIMAEDNKTIVHHKVAARVFCVLTEQDLQTALREEQQRPHHSQSRDLQQQQSAPSSSNLFNTAGSGFNFQGHNPNGPSPAQRRSASLQQQALSNMNAPASLNISMGGMGGSMRNPGKSGLTFDHILSRLHGELQKSRETGAELHTLTGSIHEIQDTLGGALHAQPPNGPLYPQNLPPVRVQPPVPPPEPVPAPAADPKIPSAALSSLQTELDDTKALLATHVEKTRSWEEIFDQLKREVYTLREMVDARDAHQHESEANDSAEGHSEFELEDPESFSDRHDEESDSEDTQSVHTIMGRELDRVEEEDENEHENESETLVNGEIDTDDDSEDSFENLQRRREELGRPRTPGLGLLREDDSYDKDFSDAAKNKNKNKIIDSIEVDSVPQSSETTLALDALTTRLSALSAQLQSAIAMSTTMQAQHAAAQSTIEMLEAKVVLLEEMVQKSTAVEAEIAETPKAAEELPIEPTAQQLEDVRREDELNAFKSTLESQFTALRAEWAAERAELLTTAQKEAQAVEERVAKQVEEALSTARAVEAQQKLRERELLQEKEQQQEREMMMSAKTQAPWLPTPPSSRGYSSDAELKSVVTAGAVDDEEDTHDVASKRQSIKMPDSPVSMTADHGEEAEPEPSTVKRQHQANGVGIHGRPAGGNHNATTIVGVLVISIVTATVLWRVKPE